MKIKEPAHAQLPLFDNRSCEDKIKFLHSLIRDMYAIYFHGARRRVLEVLDRYTCMDQDEVRNIHRIRALVEQVPNIFCQNCEIGHITGSALIVDLNTESFLLHYHKKLGKWLQFGGHFGFGEYGFELDPADVALREAEEETGIVGLDHLVKYLARREEAVVQGGLCEGVVRNSIDPVDIDIHDVPSAKGAPDHVHLDFRYVLAVPDENPVLHPPEGESTQFLWVPFGNPEYYRDKVDSSLLRLIEKAELLMPITNKKTVTKCSDL